MITSASRIARADTVVAAPLGDELMMMSIDQGAYFGLNDVGAAIWQRLDAPIAVGELCTALQAEFDVSPARCEADVLAFVAKLRDAGLVRVVG